MNFSAFLNKKSQTILELFVIFAVAAILISVGLPMYKGMQNSGKLSQAQAELKTMQAAVTAYYLNNNNTYPNSSTSLGASTLTEASPKVIRSVLYDPFIAGNSTEYGYQVSANGKYYVLYSKGPTGNGSVSIGPNGSVAISNNAVCVTNGSGCNVGAANTAGAGAATDSCGGCTGGKRCYNGTCVDVSSNTGYCGTSLTVCSAGQICTNGTCCAGGQTGCNGTCSTLSSDASNCGSCGSVCAGSCISGVCYTVPGAPTGVSATAGNASATVTFSAPASNGGSPITSYTVVCQSLMVDVVGSSSGLSTSQTVTGLINGDSYSCTVTATNVVGTGPASSASNAVTPVAYTVPGAPTGVSATAGNASATVTFSAPASNGGSPITSYTVTSSPGGLTSSGLSTSQTVTGLTNGTSYTFTVTATNAVGTGPASSASNAVTPCVNNGLGCSSDSQCCSSICHYLGCFVSGTKILLANGRIVEIQDLKGGDILQGAQGGHNKLLELMIRRRQDWKVYAFNGGRYFVTDSHSFMTTDGWKALNPQIARKENPKLKIGQLKIGDELVTLSGKVRINKIEFKTAKDSVVYNPKLDGGHDYYADSFLVHNVAVKNTCSSSCSVPAPPVIGSATAGNAQATVTFTPPTLDGGCAITSYTVMSSFGQIQPCTSSPGTVTGLTNGTSYTFTVTATNSVGTSAASSASNSVTPYTVPGAPTGVAASQCGYYIDGGPADAAEATVTFTPPASNGGSAITSYTATSNPGSLTGTGTGSPLTVMGLTYGASYTFTVTATNAAGTGPASSASGSTHAIVFCS